jgi:nucleoside-diphosphate-sugar epimerase
MANKILIIGATGQIGTELYLTLVDKHGSENVIASDVRHSDNAAFSNSKFEILDVLNNEQLTSIVTKHNIQEIYLLAALLSATAEKNPAFAWKLNMDGLFNVLNLAKDKIINKIFWPSSIAVFGPNTPADNTPQETIMQPTTVYGISKLAGEQWCQYYHEHYGVDVRSIRYPGLIGYKSAPGGGTTDYAVDIFHKAIAENKYTCFLEENMALPMMYMPDAIRATIELMESPVESIQIRNSYNLGGISFTPKEIAKAIEEHCKGFEISYDIDFRNKIASSWPNSIDDSCAQKDWNWHQEFNLERMVDDMMKNLKIVST